MFDTSNVQADLPTLLTSSFFDPNENDRQHSIFIEILDKIQESIILINTETRICYINDAYSKLFNISKEKILNKFLLKFEPLARINVVLNEKRPFIGDISHIHSANIDVYADISPLFHDKKIIGAVACMKDVTKMIRSNQEIEYFRNINNMLSTQVSAKADLPSAFSNIICRNSSFINILKVAARVAPTTAAVHIYGESGVGKEVVAEAIHYASDRANGPLIKINCAAIPETLFESELFGYDSGAFTGAKTNGKLGKFELANQGTIFLDEIGEMPLNMQVKLLRVLQEKEIERVGGTHRIKTDFRLITATNADLETMVYEGKFREDLFYRLNVIPIKIPPLRERREDIPDLANMFLEELRKTYNRKVTFSNKALMALINYQWPGNVRELKNLVEQIYILCPNDVIELTNLPVHLVQKQNKADINKLNSYKLADIVEKTERDAIASALKMVNNNKTKAIELLGISRRCFYQKLEKYNLLT